MTRTPGMTQAQQSGRYLRRNPRKARLRPRVGLPLLALFCRLCALMPSSATRRHRAKPQAFNPLLPCRRPCWPAYARVDCRAGHDHAMVHPGRAGAISPLWACTPNTGCCAINWTVPASGHRRPATLHQQAPIWLTACAATARPPPQRCVALAPDGVTPDRMHRRAPARHRQAGMCSRRRALAVEQLGGLRAIRGRQDVQTRCVQYIEPRDRKAYDVWSQVASPPNRMPVGHKSS